MSEPIWPLRAHPSLWTARVARLQDRVTLRHHFSGNRRHEKNRRVMSPERWQQIERLYHEALERESPQRAAFLGEACSGDDALRREVERR